MSPPVLLHIGYHKTATTWMQRKLFTPAHGYCQIASHAEVFANIVRPHGLRFDPVSVQSLLEAGLSGLGPGMVPVVSSEILSGHPFQGGHESDVYAERLFKIAPTARILISIRSQMKILPSVYMQYLSRGGTMPYDRFFDGASDIGYFGFTPEHFEYDLLVAWYQELFGRDRVFVLTQEQLARDMQGAAKAIAEFADNRLFSCLQPEEMRVHAASYPEYGSAVLRRINHLQESTLVPNPVVRLGKTPGGLYRAAGYLLRRPPFSTLLSGQKPVSDFVRRRFDGFYSASNLRLGAISGNPLDLSGYP